MGLAGPLHDRTGVLAEFSLAVAGLYGMKSPLWPLPSTALADGLTVINSAGDFRGYPGPIAPGYTKDMTGSFESGIYVLSTACLVSTLTAPGCASWMKAPQRGAALALS